MPEERSSASAMTDEKAAPAREQRALADHGLLHLGGTAGRIDQRGNRKSPTPPDHRRDKVDQHRLDLRQPHLEASVVGCLEQRLDLDARDFGARKRYPD